MTKLDSLCSDPRVTVRRAGAPIPGGRCVVYWMQRAQRALDNPALDVAVEAASVLQQPVVIFFAPVPFYPNANLRHFAFLAQGIPDIAQRARERGIGFVLRAYPEHSLIRFCEEVRASLVIGDENPLREPRRWREIAAQKLNVPFWTVDADVIVPSKLLEKERYAARIIRPQLQQRLQQFLPLAGTPRAKVEWQKPTLLAALPDDGSIDITEGWKQLDRSIGPVNSFRGGTREALCLLDEFVKHKLATYHENHGKPEIDGTSRLSPYLHFGNIGPHTVMQTVQKATAPQSAKDDYMNEMLHAGWMHNYMRMYWAKKILEWSPSPAVAYETALHLNDKYFLDGRDPNGYAGVAWAIGGKFDRPWFERPIFGKIRWMSGDAARKKFDVDRYIRQMRGRGYENKT